MKCKICSDYLYEEDRVGNRHNRRVFGIL